MYPPSLDQFTSFLVEGEEQTCFFEFRDQNDQLVAVSVVDMLDQGLSAIYTFYDPSLDKRSLGTFCILWQIEYSLEQGYQYLYLGYWVKSCRKMSYKIAFKPFELLIDGHWTLIQTDRK